MAYEKKPVKTSTNICCLWLFLCLQHVPVQSTRPSPCVIGMCSVGAGALAWTCVFGLYVESRARYCVQYTVFPPKCLKPQFFPSLPASQFKSCCKGLNSACNQASCSRASSHCVGREIPHGAFGNLTGKGAGRGMQRRTSASAYAFSAALRTESRDRNFVPNASVRIHRATKHVPISNFKSY